MAALAAAGHTMAIAVTAGDCPARPRQLLERFISADCERCWSQAGANAAPRDAWVLDWIVPGARGDDAPLAAAALSEARERVARMAGLAPHADAAAAQRTPLRTPAGARLSVTAGPAWKGYFGVQLDSHGRWPNGSVAWLALVEAVPAGTDGTPVPRQLVRTVAGPIAIDARQTRQRDTRAMRWPETAKPERLRATAWIESPGGQILGFARDQCARRGPG
mgnify:CR=1 FL=1